MAPFNLKNKDGLSNDYTGEWSFFTDVDREV